jgi:hypothetical protein
MKKRNVRAQFAADSPHRQKNEKGPCGPVFNFQQRVRDQGPVRQNRGAILDAGNAPKG